MDSLPDWLNGVMAAAGGSVLTFLGIRRKYSQDSNAIAKDKTETSLMATLIAERDTAMRNAENAWDQRVEDARHIAKLEAQLEAQKTETTRLREELFAMRLHVRKLTAILVKLDPHAAQLLDLNNMPRDGIDDSTVSRPAPL